MTIRPKEKTTAKPMTTVAQSEVKMIESEMEAYGEETTAEGSI